MGDVNHVVLIGRLTRDAELKYTSSGFPVSSFSIAINRRRKNGEQWEDEVHYFDVTLFGKTAESLKPYLLKGKQIAVDGELRQDRWEKDGQSRSKTYVSANNVQLLGGNTQQQGGQNAQYQQPQANNYQPVQQYQQPQQMQQQCVNANSVYNDYQGDGQVGFVEDLPF